MKFSEVENHLKEGKLSPIYLVIGPETFLRSESVRLIRQAVEAQGAHDLSELDALDGDARRLFEDLQVPSLFAPRRLAIVDNAGGLFTESASMLADYVKHPARGTVLVLLAEGLGKSGKKSRKGGKKGKGKEKDGESSKPGPAIHSRMTLVECSPLRPAELPSWCVSRSRLHGKPMDPGAARLLVELAGADLGQLDGQIQKLTAYCKDQPRISSQAVTDLVGGDHARKVWDLVNAVNDRNVALALQTLDRLLRDNEIHATGIISILARDVRRLAQVKRMDERRVPLSDIARIHCRAQDWLADKLVKAARKVPPAEIQSRLHLLLEAELACKTGGGDERWILERAIMELCGMGRTAAGGSKPAALSRASRR